MAPEILKGNPYRPISADMWSFGVLIFVMLNNTVPFKSQHMASLYTLQTTKRWIFRSDLKEKVSEDIKELVTSLLEPDVAMRSVIEDVVGHPLLDIPWNEQARQCEERALRHAKLYKGKILANMNRHCDRNMGRTGTEGSKESKATDKCLEVLFTSSDSNESSQSHIVELLSKLVGNSKPNQNVENKQQMKDALNETKSNENNVQKNTEGNINIDESKSKINKLKSLSIFNKCAKVINSKCNSVFKIEENN